MDISLSTKDSGTDSGLMSVTPSVGPPFVIIELQPVSRVTTMHSETMCFIVLFSNLLCKSIVFVVAISCQENVQYNDFNSLRFYTSKGLCVCISYWFLQQMCESIHIIIHHIGGQEKRKGFMISHESHSGCAPSMGDNLAVKIRYELGSRNR